MEKKDWETFVHRMTWLELGGVVLATLVVVVVAKKLLPSQGDSNSMEGNEEKVSKKDGAGKKKGKANGTGIEKGGKKVKQRSRTNSEDEVQHPWLAGLFRGHAEEVIDLDCSSDGKFFASCGKDRTVLIWFLRDLMKKDRKSIRVNVSFDSARLVTWSPDSKAFVIARDEEKVLEVFKVGKKADGSKVAVTPSNIKFKKEHDEEIVGLGIACTGRYIMSCSKDGQMILWDVKGSIIERVNVPVGITTWAKVSPCGRYVAVCGNDCLIYAVKFNEMDEFVSVNTHGKLKGHESRVDSVDFNTDSTKLVTVTENGYWRLFVLTGFRINIVCLGRVSISSVPCGEQRSTVALSHDSRLVAVGHDDCIDIFEVKLGNQYDPLPVVWSLPSVKKIVFTSDGRYILTCGDNLIKAYHNISGYAATAADLSNQIVSSSSISALTVRLNTELASLHAAVEKIPNPLAAEQFSTRVLQLTGKTKI